MTASRISFSVANRAAETHSRSVVIGASALFLKMIMRRVVSSCLDNANKAADSLIQIQRLYGSDEFLVIGAA